MYIHFREIWELHLKVAFCLMFRGAYIRGLIFGGKFLLVIRGGLYQGAYIRGTYIRDFSVFDMAICIQYLFGRL